MVDENGRAPKVSLVNQDRVTALKTAQDANRRAKSGRALEELSRKATTVHIQKLDDPDDVEIFSVTCYYPEAGPRVAIGRKLHWPLLELIDEPEEKYCPHCDRTLPANQFSDNGNLPDELNSRCKECEKERKRGQRRGGEAA